MRKRKIIKCILNEISSKKVYSAHYRQRCQACEEFIEEEEDLYFLGGEKICNDCLGDIIDYLEGEYEK